MKIVWTNLIDGPHFLPLDLSPPFDEIKPYANEVPMVPHVHGLENQDLYDGSPQSFWTKSGKRGPMYHTLPNYKVAKNQAVYRYMNTKEGLFWYHDHTIAMTRLNAYAGMAGGYEIVNGRISTEERNLLRIYGNLPRRFFTISDKSFYDTGELYYPDTTPLSDFTSWNPEFFGNTMTVNGKIWPKITLQRRVYRFVFLNACSSRYLNIKFESNGVPIPFELIRRDADFMQKPLTQTEHFLILSERIEIVVDFSNVVGNIIVTNNAAFPYPVGVTPD